VNLAERIVAIAKALDRGNLDWAIGGAIALAYATAEPRATRDVDIDEMFVCGTLDRGVAAHRLASIIGSADSRVGRLAVGERPND